MFVASIPLRYDAHLITFFVPYHSVSSEQLYIPAYLVQLDSLVESYKSLLWTTSIFLSCRCNWFITYQRLQITVRPVCYQRTIRTPYTYIHW